MSLCDLGFDAGDFATTWPATPMTATAEAGVLDALTLADIDHLMAFRGIRTPSVRVVHDGEVVNPRRYARAGLDGKSTAALSQVDADAVGNLMRSGGTLVLQGVEQLHPPARELGTSVARDLATPVSINTFVTPAGASGFPEHSDPYGAFLVQVAGAKRWELRASADRRAESVTLRPRDVLWIPSGWLHRGVAEPGSPSVHLTLAVVPVTVSEIITLLLAQLPGELGKTVLPPRVKLDQDGLRKAIEELSGRVATAVAGADLGPVVEAVTRRLAEDTMSPANSISAALAVGGDNDSR